jgi:hypothetical protein
LQAGTTLGEGLTCTHFDIVAVGAGFNLTSWTSGQLEGTSIHDGSITAYNFGVTAIYIAQIYIGGLVIYKSSLATACTFVGVQMYQSPDSRINNNHIEDNPSATGTWKGIILSGGLTQFCTVKGNTFDWSTASQPAILVGSAVHDCLIEGNVAGNQVGVINAVEVSADVGPNNCIKNNRSVSGTAVVNSSVYVAQQVVSGAANNGSGAIRLTVGSTAALSSNMLCLVAAIVGTTEANSLWNISVIDGTHVDLRMIDGITPSVFTHAYVSGGTLTVQNKQEISGNNPLPSQLLAQNSATPSVQSQQHPLFTTQNNSSTTITAFRGHTAGDRWTGEA